MMNFLVETIAVGAMIFVLGLTPVPAQNQQATTPAVEQTEDKGSILDEYVSGVIGDTDKYTEVIDGLVSDFSNDTIEIVEDMLKNPETSPEDMADEIEKRAEKFADDMENSGELFGHIQEIAGENFGEKFDKDTANSIVNVVRGFFGRR